MKYYNIILITNGNRYTLYVQVISLAYTDMFGKKC
jgi:hypothetical protein